MKNKRIYVLLTILVLILLSANFYKHNMDKILAFQAEREFKNNNIPKAQMYLERSFDLGFSDNKTREMYLNSIINSPFDATAQEKLLKFLEYPINDAARLKAEYFINDFRYEIYKKYPENYITKAVFNQRIMRWSNSPITYAFVNTENVPEYFIHEIENAFTRLEVATEHQILFTNNENNPNIIIEFEEKAISSENSGKYVVAYTVPETNLDVLKNMTIKFYLKNPNDAYYSKNQVYNTALHEIVHALGIMGHSDDKDNIMHSTKDSQVILNDQRDDLTFADINTIKLLYTIKPDITNSIDTKGLYTPYIVLGGEDNVKHSKMQEAVSYINAAPNLANGYIDLAEGYVANKDYENARKCLIKALKLADNSEIKGIIYFNLAVVYHYLENYGKSLSYLQGAIQINDTEDARFLLADIYSKTNQIEKSITEYQNLINKNPRNIDYVIGLANLYINNKQYFKARNVLKNYIKANPQDKQNPRLKGYGIIQLFL